MNLNDPFWAGMLIIGIMLLAGAYLAIFGKVDKRR